MTIVKVVDASAMAALIFAEREAAAVEAILGCAAIAAPGILPFELVNVCLKKLWRSPQDRLQILENFARFTSVRIDLHPIDPAEVLRLAEACRLSAYDASYLWLARRLGVELVTLDQKLIAAAAH